MVIITERDNKWYLDFGIDMAATKAKSKRPAHVPSVYNERHSRGGIHEAWKPAVDVYNRPEEIIIQAELLGMNKSSINVFLEGNTLVITGEKRKHKKLSTNGFMSEEVYYGGFNRAITLPEKVDSKKISSTYTDGILEIVLPKREKAKSAS